MRPPDKHSALRIMAGPARAYRVAIGPQGITGPGAAGKPCPAIWSPARKYPDSRPWQG